MNDQNPIDREFNKFFEIVVNKEGGAPEEAKNAMRDIFTAGFISMVKEANLIIDRTATAEEAKDQLAKIAVQVLKDTLERKARRAATA